MTSRHVFSLVFAVALVGCTSLLGDFSEGPGGGADATAEGSTEGGGDDSMPIESGSGGDVIDGSSDVGMGDVSAMDVVTTDVVTSDVKPMDVASDVPPPPCGPTTCPDGCCSNNQCVQYGNQTDASCGVAGGACAACGTNLECSKTSSGCVCDATSCPNGCCNGGLTGTCELYANQSTPSCGVGGATCAACNANLECSKSASGCVCDSTSCAMGCCSGGSTGTCELYGSQSPTSCGTNGATCGGCTTPTGAVCNSGVCGCPAGWATCNGTCIDTSSDGHNCGSCGHDCQGGGCSGSVCQPAVLVPNSAISTVQDFASNGTAVVWADIGAASIVEMPSMGGTAITLASSPKVTAPWYVGIDTSQNFYAAWIDLAGGNTNLGEATLGTANSGTIQHTFSSTTFTGMWYPQGTGSYYTQVQTGTTLGIDLCNTGGACTSLKTVTSSSGARDVAYGCGNYVVFGDASNNIVYQLYTGAYTLTSIPMPFPYYFAADSTYVYWIAQQSGNVLYRAACGSTTYTQLVTNANATRFASDGTNLYFSDSNNNLVAMPVGGGTQTVLAPAAYPEMIRYIKGAVYYLDRTTKPQIVRLVYP